MKRRSPRPAWREAVGSGSTLVLMQPDSCRPDLLSPLPSARSPLPQSASTHPHNYLQTPRLSDDPETTVLSSIAQSAVYTENYESNPTYQSEYSEDFESASVNRSTEPQYTDDFEIISSAVQSKSQSTAKVFRRSPRFVSALETIKTSITETLPEETGYSLDTFEEDSEVGPEVGNTSGRTSRLTWQYSEDFDDIIAVQAYSDSDAEAVPSTESQSSRRSVYSPPLGSVLDSEPSYTKSSPDWSERTSQAACLAESNFITRAIANLEQEPSSYVSDPSAPELRTKPYDKEEKRALKSFYTAISERLKEPSTETRTANKTADSAKYQLRGLDPEAYVENTGVSHFAINKLKLENTQTKLDKMAKEHIHEPSKCTSCIAMRDELEKNQFVRFQLHKAQERMIEEKLSNPTNVDLSSILLQKPTVLPGKIQTEMSHLSPCMIWNHLGQPRPESQVDSSDCTLSSPKHTMSKLCPHIHRELNLTDGEVVSNITEHIAKIHKEAQKTKMEIQSELEHLAQLDVKEFWKVYFQKLSGSCFNR